MVAVLVGDHVRRGELALGAEAAGQLVVERQVDVDLAVGGAVERPDTGVGLAAAGVDRAGEVVVSAGWYCLPNPAAARSVQYAWTELM